MNEQTKPFNSLEDALKPVAGLNLPPAPVDLIRLAKEFKRPQIRLEIALKLITDDKSRDQIRQLYWNELRNMSIFWDEKEKEIEFVSDKIVMTIRENITVETFGEVQDRFRKIFPVEKETESVANAVNCV